MPSNKQRREAARRHLERQLERRQQREVARRRFTLIASIAGTVVLVLVIGIWIIAVGNDDKKGNQSAAGPTPSVAEGSPTPTPTPTPTPSVSYPPAKGASVSFMGVTVNGAADLKGVPKVTSHATKAPAKLYVKDLVVGKGETATPSSTVTVQYVGVLYKTGLKFDSSWGRGMPIEFPLANVVPGFTQGIAGTDGITAMKVGGRRLIIMPAKLGYGSQASGQIPANSPLVFIVDLVKLTNGAN